jgi:hypothetical protein
VSHSIAVLAHGFGIRYDLPVPLEIYLVAGGAVVVLSFLVVALFVRAGGEGIDYPRLGLDRVPLLGALTRSAELRVAGAVVGVIGLLAIILTGWLGSTSATFNPAEYLLWIYFWVGMVLLSALVGNLYALLNPFAALYDLLSRVLPIRRDGYRAYPARAGIWPATAGYFVFAFFELASGQAARPRAVAAAVVIYTLYTLAMMVVFGRETWLRRGETFSVLFTLIGAFSPLGRERGSTVTGEREDGRDGGLYLRPWAVGLLRLDRRGWDVVAFLVLTISSLAFDGFSATPPWAALYGSLGDVQGALNGLGPVVVKGLGLVAFAGLFLAVFLAFIALVHRVGGGSGTDTLTAASLFAYTLFPIALVYNAAHYYSYLVIQGQGLWPLLSDPLRNGANLLPAIAGYKPSFALADAGLVWYLQVTLIVVGHVLAVYLAHRRALTIYRDARAAVRSQVPMLVLMVLYTSVSLWILAQPITEAG